jgi:hypothetical protein
MLDSSITIDPETLRLLQGVFNRCVGKLEHLYGPNSSQLSARRPLIATRLISLTEQGVADPDLLEKQALVGLIPEYPY